jgi:hypothetical protein
MTVDGTAKQGQRNGPPDTVVTTRVARPEGTLTSAITHSACEGEITDCVEFKKPENMDKLKV